MGVTESKPVQGYNRVNFEDYMKLKENKRKSL